jgi:hypothetical protein
MQKSILQHLLAAGVAALAMTLGTSAFAQGITSSGMNGFVTDKQGAPMGGATVSAVHEPSGTHAGTTARSNGQYTLSGLRVGGPYTVTATATGHQAEIRHDVYLDLGSSQELNFSLTPEVVQMEAFNVQAERDVTFGAGKIGTGISLDSGQVASVPTVRNNIQDIATLDSRITIMSLDQGGQMSAQGQNLRYNSFLIDGVQAIDPFGLNGNGFSSLRSPIPLEAIESVDISLTPYDVRRAGFTGALVNAVVKSGTNEFHGSATTLYTGQNWRAKNPVNLLREVFKENTYTYTLGGPVIKDKLFFFLTYDEFMRASAPPAQNFVPNADQVARILTRAQALGYSPGSFNAISYSKQRTTLGKLDWNISDKHRLSLTYRRNHGQEPSISSSNFTGTTTTSFSNYWFQQPRNTESYTAQLFSQWTPDFRTDAFISYTTYDGSPKNNGTPFPSVQIQGVPGIRLDNGLAANGNVFLGTENSRQMNFITTKETNASISGEYSIGNHTLTVGGESDQTKYVNKFAQNIFGNYTFSNVTNWEGGSTISQYVLAKPFTGYSIADAFAFWKYTAYGAYIQDMWKPNSQFSLMAGVRLDYPYVPQKPPFSQAFQDAFGIRNDTTNSGNSTIGPRVGFTYEPGLFGRKTQLRGGIGLFQGKNPAVWISNAYSNAGALGNVTVNSPAVTFSPDVNNQPVPTGVPPAPNINITSPHFRQPSLWKGNLAIDHTLPWGGWIASVEYDQFKTQDALNTLFLNYQEATSGPATLPDGRIRYAGTITPTGTVNGVSYPSTNTAGRRRVTTFADVFYLANTQKGTGTSFTMALTRPLKHNWAASISYTRTHATEVSPMTSSTASSNYNLRAVFNPNEDVASLANYSIKDRIVATFTYEAELFKNAPTTVSVVYEGRTGRPYSWVFRGDANGDGFAFNDLLYMPYDSSDPKVRWTAVAGAVPTATDIAARDSFFAFAKGTNLQNFLGRTVPRNSEFMPWIQTVDLKITQEVPIWKKVRSELFFNVLNIANLFNDRWGILQEVDFAYRRGVVGATFDPVGNGGAGQWVYVFNAANVDAVKTVANDQPVSRWQIQTGLRVRF